MQISNSKKSNFATKTDTSKAFDQTKYSVINSEISNFRISKFVRI